MTQHLSPGNKPIPPLPPATPTHPKMNFLFEIHQVFSTLFSEDPATRRMAFFFLFNILGLISVGGIELNRRWIVHQKQKILMAQKDAQRIQAWTRKMQPNSDIRAHTLSLGSFILTLTPLQEPHEENLLQLAEVEMVLLCRDGATRTWIDSHLEQTRDLLLQVIPPIHRQELLSREGKKKFKLAIKEGLNRKLPSEQHIEDLFFSKLILN